MQWKVVGVCAAVLVSLNLCNALVVSKFGQFCSVTPSRHDKKLTCRRCISTDVEQMWDQVKDWAYNSTEAQLFYDFVMENVEPERRFYEVKEWAKTHANETAVKIMEELEEQRDEIKSWLKENVPIDEVLGSDFAIEAKATVSSWKEMINDWKDGKTSFDWTDEFPDIPLFDESSLLKPVAKFVGWALEKVADIYESGTEAGKKLVHVGWGEVKDKVREVDISPLLGELCLDLYFTPCNPMLGVQMDFRQRDDLDEENVNVLADFVIKFPGKALQIPRDLDPCVDEKKVCYDHDVNGVNFPKVCSSRILGGKVFCFELENLHITDRSIDFVPVVYFDQVTSNLNISIASRFDEIVIGGDNGTHCEDPSAELAYAAIDKNGDSRITVAEYENAMLALGAQPKSEVISKMDPEGTGEISYSNFKTVTAEEALKVENGSASSSSSGGASFGAGVGVGMLITVAVGAASYGGWYFYQKRKGGAPNKKLMI